MAPWIRIERSERPAASARRRPPSRGAAQPPRRVNVGAVAMVLVLVVGILAILAGREQWTSLLPARGLTADVLALVNGESIREADVDLEFAVQSAIQSQLGRTLNTDPDAVRGFRRDLLDQLVDRQLLLQAAQASGISVSDAELDAELPKLGQGYGLDTSAIESAALAAGATSEQFREWARRELVVGRYLTSEQARQAGLQSYRDRGYSEEQLAAVAIKPSDVASTLQKTADIRFNFGGREAARIAREGEPAPDFVLRDLTGRPARLSEYRGKPVLVNFWATWCTPCKAEMPMFVRAHNEHQAEGLVVLALDVQEKTDAVNSFLAALPLPFPVLLDERGEVASLYRVRGLPSSYFINGDGLLVKAKRGQVKSEAELALLLDSILQTGR